VAEPPFEGQRVDHVCVRSERRRVAPDDRTATDLRFAHAYVDPVEVAGNAVKELDGGAQVGLRTPASCVMGLSYEGCSSFLLVPAGAPHLSRLSVFHPALRPVRFEGLLIGPGKLIEGCFGMSRDLWVVKYCAGSQGANCTISVLRTLG
jgi:hypothetical protein